MSILSVEQIPTRNWKEPKSSLELVFEFDKNRKKSQQQVDERIHYLWFHYLKLCLNLEGIEHSIEKKGRGGKVISKTKVKVSKTIYTKCVLLQMELEKSISRVSHFLIVQLRCNFNRIFT